MIPVLSYKHGKDSKEDFEPGKRNKRELRRNLRKRRKVLEEKTLPSATRSYNPRPKTHLKRRE